MRATLMFFIFLISSLNAFAVSDRRVLNEIRALKNDLAAERTASVRLERFEIFQDFLFDHLQTMPLPADNDETAKEQFADLNELQADLSLVNVETLNAASCRNAVEKVKSGNTDPSNDDPAAPMPPAAQLTLEIIGALCR